MNREQLCREFAELNEIPWYDTNCDCGICNYCNGKAKNPTSPDAKSILEVMMRRDDWKDFHDKSNLFRSIYAGKESFPFLCIDCILDSDKLLLTAVEWCKEHKR